jgi:hypothetical protein
MPHERGVTTSLNNRWIDVMSGSAHLNLMNSMNKVHAARINGKDPLLIFPIFTLSIKKDDRYFAEWPGVIMF